ncbi:molecular chaperone HtpG [Lysobacteraceae bacterium NML08-0793]|nr:molecular chaperone HtpG [Xanthomonadaceae bacterium NML08-0793]
MPVSLSDFPATTSIHRAGVDMSGLMSVLSKHLYSTPMVALRELVQNAHDSILRRRLEEPGWTAPARIDILPDSANNRLRIIDTGAGLTEQEIHQYLATVGVGYTRRLREGGHEESGLIGMFGLGFLSAFVLAKRVTVRTTSWQSPDSGCRYVSSNAEQYTVAAMPARAVGTEITLELKDEYQALTQTAHLHEVLGHYCALLAEPIHIAGEPEAINPEPPPWRRPADAPALLPLQQRKQEHAFAARFEHSFEPVCTMPVKPDAHSDAIGILWVQDGATYGTSDNRNLSVFLRGMLLDDDARELLPHWAGFVGGVIESQRMTPTASREDLQRDEHYEATRHALTEALIDGLAEVARNQPEAWRRVLWRHNEALLGAALCDERLFQLLKDSLRIPTSHGDLPANELLARGAVHVMLDNKAGFEGMLFNTLGIPVAHGNRYAVVPFLRRWAEARGVRLAELGTDAGNRQLFRPAPLPSEKQDWLSQQLCDGEELIAAHFAPQELPLVVVPDRDSALKKRLEEDNHDKQVSLAALRLARQFTAKIADRQPARLYLNLDNPAVQSLLASIDSNPANAGNAAALLRAFKTILASNTPGNANAAQSREKLSAALHQLADSIQQLTRHNPQEQSQA